MSEKVTEFLLTQGISPGEIKHYGTPGMKWGVRKTRRMESRAVKGEARLSKNKNRVGRANGKSIVKGILSGVVSLAAGHTALSLAVGVPLMTAAMPAVVIPALLTGAGALAVTSIASAGLMSKSIGEIRNVSAAEKIRERDNA